MPENWTTQFEDLIASPALRQWAPLLAGAVGLALLLVIVRKIMRWLRRPRLPAIVDPSLVIDVAALPLPASDAVLRLTVYHVPVRLCGAVIAPLGRDAEPLLRASVPRLLAAAVPGLDAICSGDDPLVRIWPRQLSATGFAHSLARHVTLPGAKGKGSPWCLVAGRVSVGAQAFAIGLILAAAAPNNLSLITIESDHQWLDVLRVRSG